MVTNHLWIHNIRIMGRFIAYIVVQLDSTPFGQYQSRIDLLNCIAEEMVRGKMCYMGKYETGLVYEAAFIIQ